MTVIVHSNIFSNDEIQTLLSFFEKNDNFLNPVDDSYKEILKNRHHYERTKNLDWTDAWPRDIIKSKLDDILEPYEIETIFINRTVTHFGIHADTGSYHDLIYKNVLIPLEYQGPSYTIFFNNHLNRVQARLCKNPVHVRDNEEVISDYREIGNYNESAKFNTEVYSKYFKHTDIGELDGLTFDRAYQWNIGDLVTWDRTQLHCAGEEHTYKTWLSIFTNYRKYSD
jgi:hypothetical protein